MVERHLAQADRHVSQSERHVAQQRARIAYLERRRHDAVEAQVLLGEFEKCLGLHVEHRDRLKKMLAAA